MRFVIALLFLVSVTNAQEWNMGVVEGQIDVATNTQEWNMGVLEQRVDEVEKRLDKIEAKLESEPEEIESEPEIVENTGWKGTKPTNKGREVLYFGADWCPDCSTAEERLDEYKSQIVYIDCTDDDTLAGLYRVDSYPSMIAIDDGMKIDGLHTEGSSVGSFFAEKWLTKSEPRSRTKNFKRSNRVHVHDSRAGHVHNSRGPGHTHRCAYCGNTWSHENFNVGDPIAHTCPNCGQITWGNRTEGWNTQPRQSARRWQPIRIQSTPTYSTPFIQGCPSGMCPL